MNPTHIEPMSLVVSTTDETNEDIIDMIFGAVESILNLHEISEGKFEVDFILTTEFIIPSKKDQLEDIKPKRMSMNSTKIKPIWWLKTHMI